MLELEAKNRSKVPFQAQHYSVQTFVDAKLIPLPGTITYPLPRQTFEVDDYFPVPPYEVGYVI